MSSQSVPLATSAEPAHAHATPAAGSGALLAMFTAAVFLSAFLLFLVQPMFGKMVLPLLGGSPAVWNTCMLFFQAALLGGYLYAHVSSRWTVRRQAIVHLALLALAALALPVTVRGAVPPGGGAPIPWLLALMAMTVGAPFLMLSGTGVVLQRWFSRSGHPQAAEPYQLYAASNLGSALALLAYPFLMEPRMRLAGQSGTWAIGYGLLALLIAACAWRVWRTADALASIQSPVSSESAAADASVSSASAASMDAPASTASTAADASIASAESTASAGSIASPGSTASAGSIASPGSTASAESSASLGSAAADVSIASANTTASTGSTASVESPASAGSIAADTSIASPATTATAEVRAEGAPTLRERLIWTGLAFIPSSLLLAVTTYVTTDLSPAPLLWVLPLALYLLSFTLVFARRPLLPHAWMVAVQPAAIGAAVLLLAGGHLKSVAFAVPLHLLGLFVVSMTAHGELARRRPHPRHLTEFYLWISVGGVLGGVFNALVAPVVFNDVWEYPIILALACLARPWPEERLDWRKHLFALVRAAAFAYALIYLTRQDTLAPLVVVIVGFLLVSLLSVGLRRTPVWLMACIGTVLAVRVYATLTEPGVLLAERTFFGRYKVMHFEPAGGFHVLRHGSTLHGAQSLQPNRRREPLTYYLQHGPLGQIFFASILRQGERRVAVVGLGTGTTAAYISEGEQWTFYEIDPGIERIARDTAYFTYMSDAPVRPRVVLGDARLQLARDSAQKYDLILLDAFSSDAIPVHLITREALDTYLSRLAPGGIVAFHVSNRYLDLEPVVAALAKDRGLAARAGQGPRGMRDTYESNSTWIALARQEADLGPLTADVQWWVPRLRDDVDVWTDDYSSLLTVFEWD
ncbi:MAG TPA: fused MFS/spermidine synthase [Longimicrobium sp.]|nr:fused MFS/spermidine synthase [Longimicrobium sp.]